MYERQKLREGACSVGLLLRECVAQAKQRLAPASAEAADEHVTILPVSQQSLRVCLAGFPKRDSKASAARGTAIGNAWNTHRQDMQYALFLRKGSIVQQDVEPTACRDALVLGELLERLRLRLRV